MASEHPTGLRALQATRGKPSAGFVTRGDKTPCWRAPGAPPALGPVR